MENWQQAYDSLKEDVAEVKEGVKAIRVAVVGNGKPQGCIIDRLARVEEIQKSKDKGTSRLLTVTALGIALMAVVVAIFK